jgi:hypothetical protein
VYRLAESTCNGNGDTVGGVWLHRAAHEGAEAVDVPPRGAEWLLVDDVDGPDVDSYHERVASARGATRWAPAAGGGAKRGFV